MITRKDVGYIAELARLSLTENEAQEAAGQLGSILGYIEQLNTVDTTGIEPTCFMVPDYSPVREDIVVPSLSVEEALGNGPSTIDGFFAVPKVIGK